MRSLANLRESVSRHLGDWLECSTTTNLTGTDTFVVSTELASYGDNFFADNFYLLITSGSNNVGTKRVVKKFIQAESKLELYGSNLSAESVAVTFELHRYDPDEIATYINKARLEVYPVLNIPVVVPNHHFEVWSQTAYPDHWRVSGVTALKETTTNHNGVASAKVTRAGTDGYLYTSTFLGTPVLPLDVYDALFALEGQKVKFARWVQATTALQARLCIYCGSSELTKYSPYHSGDGSWEYLEVEMDIPWNPSRIEFRCEVITTNGAVYFDGAGSAELGFIPNAGYLSSVSVDSDEMELNTEQALGLEYLAAALLLEGNVMPIGSESVGRTAGESDRLKRQAREILGAHRTKPPVFKMNYGWQKDFPT